MPSVGAIHLIPGRSLVKHDLAAGGSYATIRLQGLISSSEGRRHFPVLRRVLCHRCASLEKDLRQHCSDSACFCEREEVRRGFEITNRILSAPAFFRTACDGVAEDADFTSVGIWLDAPTLLEHCGSGLDLHRHAGDVYDGRRREQRRSLFLSSKQTGEMRSLGMASLSCPRVGPGPRRPTRRSPVQAVAARAARGCHQSGALARGRSVWSTGARAGFFMRRRALHHASGPVPSATDERARRVATGSEWAGHGAPHGSRMNEARTRWSGA
jgi:hypothetical protein